jgi:DNA-binding transcriptional LysR family regulator
MDLRWLDDFLTVVDCGSFTQAAQRRGVSQSGLSRRIQALEQWVGSPLFDRLAQPLLLTAAGRRFTPLAIGLRSMFDAAQRHEPSRDAHTVTIATSDGFEAGLLPLLLGRIRRQFPDTPLRAVSHDERRARAALLSGQALRWVVGQDPQAPIELMPELFHAKRVARDRLMPVVGARGGRPLFELPGTRQRPVPVIDYADAHPLATFLSQRLARERSLPHLRVACVAESMHALRALVAQGLGLGVVCESMVSEELRAGELLCAQPRWTSAVDVLMVRPRCAIRSTPATAVASAIWDQTVELPEEPRNPPTTSAGRGALLLSDVVA